MSDAEITRVPVKLLLQIREGVFNDITPQDGATVRLTNTRPSEVPGAEFDHDAPTLDIANVLLHGFVELTQGALERSSAEDRQAVREWLSTVLDHVEVTLLTDPE